MFKLTKCILTALACSLLVTSISADDSDFKNQGKGRLIFGMGLHFDPNSLGNTVLKDGLNSGQARTDSNGNYAGTQQAIIPDNNLITLHKLTGGAFGVKAGGPMTAGVLSLGYEKDLGENFFWRVGLNYTTKISGGHSSSTFMGYTWYDAVWNYRSYTVPVYLGIKLNVGKKSAIYVAPGLHYYDVRWNLKGTNDGTGLDALTANQAKSLPVASSAARPAVLHEDTVFAGRGIGFNWLTGVQTKITESGYVFLETEVFISGSQQVGAAKSAGGISALSPYPTYPVSATGTYYKFGYKLEF